MISRIKNLLQSGPGAEQRNAHERVQVATCVLLLELAHTDGDFHAMEEQLVNDLLRNRFQLDDQTLEELIEFSRQQREGALDLYQFARTINENFSRDEKFEVMVELWRVVYCDGVLDKYEEYLMRQLAKLLRQSHREMIAAKLKVLDETRP